MSQINCTRAVKQKLRRIETEISRPSDNDRRSISKVLNLILKHLCRKIALLHRWRKKLLVGWPPWKVIKCPGWLYFFWSRELISSSTARRSYTRPRDNVCSRTLLSLTFSKGFQSLVNCYGTFCTLFSFQWLRFGQGTLWKTASLQPSEEQLLPLRTGILWSHGASGGNRTCCVRWFHWTSSCKFF